MSGDDFKWLPDNSPPPPPPSFQPLTSDSGGLKLPPFSPQKQQRAPHMLPIPVNYMSEEQTNELKGYIFAQLDDFDAFPPLSEVDKDPNGRSVFSLGSTRQSAPATPLFSPIPFLHDDARRSKSRSPPPSPLALAPSAIGVEHPEPLGPRALGLVDELDDPSPGHMSDHPTALSSTTTGDSSTSRPFLGSLEQRFVKSKTGTDEQAASDNMMVDEDKENKS
ncbi:hypothetical protein H0H87_004994 [Tephrocybe sp. NHM501043]|nr:hypothetical protein H0H87_004994 [Tephrocybe sp. NHM501043]